MIDTFHGPTELSIVRCNTLFSRSSFAPLSNENVTEIVENNGKKKQHSSSLTNNHACPLLVETHTRGDARKSKKLIKFLFFKMVYNMLFLLLKEKRIFY